MNFGRRPPPPERGPHPRDLDFTPSNQEPRPMRQVLQAANAAELRDETPAAQRLREIVIAAEKAPRAAAQNLSQAIEIMRSHLERRRKLLLAAIEEYNTHCDQAEAALNIMVGGVDKVNEDFANAIRPTPINPEAPTPRDEIFNSDGSLREASTALDTDNDCAP